MFAPSPLSASEPEVGRNAVPIDSASIYSETQRQQDLSHRFQRTSQYGGFGIGEPAARLIGVMQTAPTSLRQRSLPLGSAWPPRQTAQRTGVPHPIATRRPGHPPAYLTRPLQPQAPSHHHRSGYDQTHPSGRTARRLNPHYQLPSRRISVDPRTPWPFPAVDSFDRKK